jgi:hypothetical protein
VADHLDDGRRPAAGRADGLPRGLKTHAREDAAPVGFLGRLTGISGRWKLAAREVADTGEWLAAHPHVLVIAPDLFAGLTHKQLDAIEAWLRGGQREPRFADSEE